MHRFLLATAIVTLFLPSTAWAHDLGASCEIVGDKLKIETYYPENEPARQAIVRLFADRETVAEGKTDEKGGCILPCPKPGTYRIVVEARDGHRAERKVVVPAAEPVVPPPEPSIPSSPPPQTVSDGPTRQEFTSYPWLKVGQGVGGIGLLALAIWGVRFLFRHLSTTT